MCTGGYGVQQRAGFLFLHVAAIYVKVMEQTKKSLKVSFGASLPKTLYLYVIIYSVSVLTTRSGHSRQMSCNKAPGKACQCLLTADLNPVLCCTLSPPVWPCTFKDVLTWVSFFFFTIAQVTVNKCIIKSVQKS